MDEVCTIEHNWDLVATAIGTSLIFAAIVATLFCLQDFIRYIRERYFD